ncbi:unnamed protein product, partial [Allacma fusca]
CLSKALKSSVSPRVFLNFEGLLDPFLDVFKMRINLSKTIDRDEWFRLTSVLFTLFVEYPEAYCYIHTTRGLWSAGNEM